MGVRQRVGLRHKQRVTKPGSWTRRRQGPRRTRCPELSTRPRAGRRPALPQTLHALRQTCWLVRPNSQTLSSAGNAQRIRECRMASYAQRFPGPGHSAGQEMQVCRRRGFLRQALSAAHNLVEPVQPRARGFDGPKPMWRTRPGSVRPAVRNQCGKRAPPDFKPERLTRRALPPSLPRYRIRRGASFYNPHDSTPQAR